MRTITRMLLASMLAIGASSFAGCADADCPSTITAGASCSAAGLSCSVGAEYCTCVNGQWACMDDLPVTVVHDLSMHDLSMPDQGPSGD
jgi:hypothetical protein